MCKRQQRRVQNGTQPICLASSHGRWVHVGKRQLNLSEQRTLDTASKLDAIRYDGSTISRLLACISICRSSAKKQVSGVAEAGTATWTEQSGNSHVKMHRWKEEEVFCWYVCCDAIWSQFAHFFRWLSWLYTITHFLLMMKTLHRTSGRKQLAWCLNH